MSKKNGTKDTGTAAAPEPEVAAPAAAPEGWKLRPDCFAARKGRGKRGWPSQNTVEEHLKKVHSIIDGIKKRNGLRYDFSVADALFDRALHLYEDGRFGQVEVDGKMYPNLVDFLYQGVLGAADAAAASGKMADARRILEEAGSNPADLKDIEVEVAFLLHEGESREAAKVAHEALKAALARRKEKAAEERRKFAAQLGFSVADRIGDEKKRAVYAAVERKNKKRGAGGRRSARAEI